jgi:hypothetical protein
MPYSPGRDDTKFGKLARELHAETSAYLAAITHMPDIELSADLNDRLAGRWAVWFEATGSTTLWKGRRTSGGPMLTADSSDELLAKIEEEDT